MTDLPGPGHNRGPAMDRGVSWRRHCWSVARAELLPHLPIEIIRTRVRRARELGHDYPTYALARETTGRDIIAFLFSSNALRLLRPEDTLPAPRIEKLAALTGCDQALLAHPPLDPDRIATALARNGITLAGAGRAPAAFAPWREIAARVRTALPPGQPSAGVFVVGDAGPERDWAEAGRLGGFLAAERYFGSA